MTLKQARKSIERHFIAGKLGDHKGNVTATAKSLGVSRCYMHRLLKSHGLKAADYR